MHLHFRFAVFEGVFRDLCLVRKFAALPDWHKADTKFIRNGRSKQKAARIDPDNFVDLNATTSFQTGVMSLNTMPFFGKSGTSRTAARSLPTIPEAIGANVAGRGKTSIRAFFLLSLFLFLFRTTIRSWASTMQDCQL